MRQQRGTSLGTVIMIATVGMLAAFTVASTATFQLQAAVRVENQQAATDLADAAIQQTIGELMHDASFGTVRATRVDVPGRPGMAGDARGWVTFDPSNSERNAYSTNNKDGSQASGWSGRAVPLSKCHLIGIGRSGGVLKRIEVMVHLPKFPRAVAGDGTVELTNSLVASIQKPSDVTWDASGNLVLDPKKLDRGDLISNDSIVLRGNSRVTGTTQALLSVQRLDTSIIEGEVLSPYERSPLPNIKVEDYDPKANPDLYFVTKPSGVLPSQSLTGTTRFKAGNVEISGDLTLDNAVIYVEGNLTVRGSFKGVGTVFVKGNTSVSGGVRLAAADNVALISEGDVRLRGDGKNTSVFQGLVYTRGSLSASQLTIVGSFLSESLNGVAGRVFLNDVNCLSCGPFSGPNTFHEVAYVVPRFGPDCGQSNQRFGPNPDGVTTGTCLFPPSTTPRTVRNVLGLDGYGDGSLSSHWRNDDCAVVRIVKVGNSYQYYYGWWGRGSPTTDEASYTLDNGNRVPAIGWIGPTATPAALGAAVRTAEDTDYARNDAGVAVNGALLESRLIASATAATVDLGGDNPGVNFNVAPNRFLGEGESTRILYRRELTN